MIEQTTAYRVGEQVFPTIQEAQVSELVPIFETAATDNHEVALDVARLIVSHTDEIVAILTCQPKRKKPRADKGGSHRKRTKATAATAAPLTT